MKSTKSILEEYAKANWDKRLHLFLECPSLRTSFMEMDQNEMGGGASEEPSGPHAS